MKYDLKSKIEMGFWIIISITFGLSLSYVISEKIKINQIKNKAEVISIDTQKTIQDTPEIKTKKEEEILNLAFLGDIMMTRGVEKSVNKNFNGDYSKIFENLQILKEKDIVFANLESVVSDKGKDTGSVYSFRMNPKVLPVLKEIGIDIVSVANNHVGDWNRIAYTDTLIRLKKEGILYTGGGLNNAEAEQPTIIEKNGIKLGFIGFSDKGPNWMEVDENKSGLLLASNSRFEEIIKNASEKVDYLIVSFHFGEEYKTKHDKRQEELAHRAIDAGAKIIIGHHPHVIEDTEIYKDSFIAYSLGNFIFDQSWSEPTMEGMLLEMKLHKDGKIETQKNIFKLNKFFQPILQPGSISQ